MSSGMVARHTWTFKPGGAFTINAGDGVFCRNPYWWLSLVGYEGICADDVAGVPFARLDWL
jgi:hypothetical protein